MKLGKACVQCRDAKRKCEKPIKWEACTQCRTRHLHCSGLSSSRRQHPTLLPTSKAEDEYPGPPDQEVLRELIGLYILYIHDKPHSLFHGPTLTRQAMDGTLCRAVLFGILGLSARFSSDAEVRKKGKTFALVAKKYLKSDLENVCLDNIQACILIANICGADTEANSESLYFAIANRMAQLLKLYERNPRDDDITHETKRRVWWTLYLIDRWASAGLGLPRQFFYSGPPPPPPMDEYIFQHLREGDIIQESDLSKLGIWAHMISLVRIFGHIQDFNRQLVNRAEWDEDSTQLAAQELAAEMTQYEENLPHDIRYCLQNLEAQVAKGTGRTFVALHLGYHHYAILLYYQYLDRHRPPTPQVKMYTARCKYHAAAFSDLISLSRTHGQAEALYNIVGHMTVVSSSVLLHTLLFGDEDELPHARRRLESNFEALVELRSYWQSVELMTNRLITFQNSCLESVASDTHNIDKWMLKFLLQHALELGDKVAFRQSVDARTGDWGSAGAEMRTLFERSRITEGIIREVQAALC